MDKAALERRLSELAGFADPRAEFEQYPTPAWLAAHLVHLADLQGDLAGRTVLDLGTGTGVLALAAATRDPERVVGIERGRAALETARENERAFLGEGSHERSFPGTGSHETAPVHWILGDATRPPVVSLGPTTVVMNPPFGAQRGNEGADRAFLETAAELADVSYSIHNEGSRAFVEAFAGDEGGAVTHAFAAEFELGRQFEFHEAARREIPVEVFRIEWS